MRTNRGSGSVTVPGTWLLFAISHSTSFAKPQIRYPSSGVASEHYWTLATCSKSLARSAVNLDSLPRALANEGGGHIVLGVTDKRPRRVVGSQAFDELQRTKLGLLERLRLRIEVWEIAHSNGRVLVFEVPGRP